MRQQPSGNIFEYVIKSVYLLSKINHSDGLKNETEIPYRIPARNGLKQLLENFIIFTLEAFHLHLQFW